MGKFLKLLLIVLVLVILSPMFVYWWGLSNVQIVPVASKSQITYEKKMEIWKKEFGQGEPRIEPITPYGYIAYIYCGTTYGPRSSECQLQYPGLRLSALAVRTHVSEQVRGKGNTVWQVSWMAYSIWATKNWNINQILATYHDAYNT